MSRSNDADETIEVLRAARRREAQADPRWRALSLGTLSQNEAESLRREAPDLYEIHRPFDEHEHQQLFDRVHARRQRKSRVVTLAWWRNKLPRVAAVAVAASFALAVASLWQQPLELAWSAPRGGSPEAPHLSSAPGARLTELIVPVRPVPGTIAIRGAFLSRPGATGRGRMHTWPLSVTPTRDNEIIISGTREQLFLGVDSGDWDMVVIVGRPGPALTSDEARTLVDRGSDRELRILRKRIVLDGPCVGDPTHPCHEDAP